MNVSRTLAAEPAAPVPRRFVGRKWILGIITDWLSGDQEAFVLTGPPGSGKSALVEHLAARPPRHDRPVWSAVYRCVARKRSTCDPVRFVETLAEQLSGTVPGFASSLVQVSSELVGRTIGEVSIHGSASVQQAAENATVTGVRITIRNTTVDEAVDRLLYRPLTRLQLATTPTVLIDAIDEALTYGGQSTIPELILGRARDLPLRFMVTTRPDPRILSSIEDSRAVDLVDDAPLDVDDIKEYALGELTNLARRRRDRDLVAERISRASKGNFLYAYHLVRELQGGVRSIEEVLAGAGLPEGLSGLYMDFLQREVRPPANAERETHWRHVVRPCSRLSLARRETA